MKRTYPTRCFKNVLLIIGTEGNWPYFFSVPIRTSDETALLCYYSKSNSFPVINNVLNTSVGFFQFFFFFLMGEGICLLIIPLSSPLGGWFSLWLLTSISLLGFNQSIDQLIKILCTTKQGPNICATILVIPTLRNVYA